MNVQRHVSAFTGGMRQDLHPSMQPANTYVHANGFSLRFAETGGMVLTAEAPPQLQALLPYGAVVRGGALLPDDRILLLLNIGGSTASPGPRRGMIAVLAGDQVSVLFDDQYDPNGDTLAFPEVEVVRVIVEKESASITRLYLNDTVNPPRCITLGEYPGPAATYPRSWSVHSFTNQPPVQYDLIYFLGTVPGSCQTGFYRYTYRYARPGVVSTPFPLSTPLTLAEKSGTVDVQLGASGITTGMGLSFQVDSPDRRWPMIELLVSYSPDGTAWSNLVIGERKAIPDTGTVTLSLSRPSGTGLSVPLSELSAQSYQQIVTRAADMVAVKHKLLFGNIQLSVPGQPPVAGITLSPAIESMSCDDVPDLIRPPLAFTIADYTPILERQYQPRSGSAVRTRSFTVDGGLRDYRSIQYGNRRVGLRRGERYPYAVVLFDLLGQPSFAWPIGTFEVPQYYDGSNATDAPNTPLIQINTPTGPAYRLRIMGCRVDGLQLPESILFDSTGKLIVSGFAIVRGDASGLIRHQGVVLPAISGVNNPDEISMLPDWHNTFTAQPENGRFRLLGSAAQDGNAYVHQPGWVTYHSPDLLLDGTIETQPVGANLRLVGSAHGPDNGRQGTVMLAGGKDHYYVKAYTFRPDNFRPDAPGRWKVSETSPVAYGYRLATPTNLEKFYAENNNIKFRNQLAPNMGYPTGSGVKQSKGIGQLGAYLLRVRGSSLADRGISESQPSGVGIANYEVATPDLNPLAANYAWTGHYQPLTQAVLDDLPVTQDSVGRRTWTVSNVDVWGGDTYLCRADMARVLPQYDTGYGSENDYALGLFLPIESRYNLYLRYGRRYEKVATMPQLTARDGSLSEFTRGINEFQPEEWFINRGVVIKESLHTFPVLPPDTRIETSWPQGLAWSKLKTDTELLDNYRRIPAQNLFLLEGEYGAINGLITLFDNLYVGQQRAVSQVSVDLREVIPTQSGQPLSVATGREVGPAEYLSRTTGWQRRQHAWSSPRSFYFVDARQHKFFRFSQAGLEPISDRDGYHNQLLSDELNDYTGCFDSRDDTVHLLGPLGRVAYNEVLNCFVSAHENNPSPWIEIGGVPMTQPAGEYNVVIPGRLSRTLSLSFVVNPMPGQPKTFGTGILSCSRALFDCLENVAVSTDQQPATVIEKNRMRWREGRVWLPLRATEGGEPMRGSTMNVTINFSNVGGQPGYWLLKWETDFRIPFRP